MHPIPITWYYLDPSFIRNFIHKDHHGFMRVLNEPSSSFPSLHLDPTVPMEYPHGSTEAQGGGHGAAQE